MSNYERHVEFAVGFSDGTWREVDVVIEEEEDRVLDEDEVVMAAKVLLEKIDFDQPVTFYHTLYISPPEGGYADD